MCAAVPYTTEGGVWLCVCVCRCRHDGSPKRAQPCTYQNGCAPLCSMMTHFTFVLHSIIRLHGAYTTRRTNVGARHTHAGQRLRLVSGHPSMPACVQSIGRRSWRKFTHVPSKVFCVWFCWCRLIYAPISLHTYNYMHIYNEFRTLIFPLCSWPQHQNINACVCVQWFNR